MYPITIDVDSSLKIQSVQELYAEDLYLLINDNYERLKIYLPDVLIINYFDSALEHIRHCQNLALKNELLEFYIFFNNKLCGAMRLNLSFHKALKQCGFMMKVTLALSTNKKLSQPYEGQYYILFKYINDSSSPLSRYKFQLNHLNLSTRVGVTTNDEFPSES
ncbi:hypothetical protein DSM106972_086640 [Dulcicalothrix desertica PCC 7102]|uniref:Uncharacterized protein n=1 Tax=Dulcicalothrix desertica PCC 7102 TaxID=232991 RepID=A0A433US26_9CYAN|nr:hypothetical protein [Dulcicalothrix desertica]RUS96641.1 hypothetical protein DSM106972_086640 [Dulcicalothrix desertica PCC 7102]TWH43886.1 hypothetical protein CAL7102_07637 [Dulcicalothrix desertica PCC 7102]